MTPKNPHKGIKDIKKSLSKYSSDMEVNYDKFYNDINYVSPGIHLGLYYPTCIDLVSKGDKWLDVGCGSCGVLKKAINMGIEVHGMDIVDKSIEQANKNGINCIKNSAAEKYPYPSNTFELVTSIDVLEHLHTSDVISALTEIYRVLKPNHFAVLAPYPFQDRTGHLHLTVKPTKWWVSQCEAVGFKYIKHINPHGLILKKLK